MGSLALVRGEVLRQNESRTQSVVTGLMSGAGFSLSRRRGGVGGGCRVCVYGWCGAGPAVVDDS
jgi:hypothetical protein